METLDNDVSNEGVAINSQISGFLKETAKWANFMAIVSFVMLGLMVLGAFGFMALGSSIGGGSAVAAGVLYLLLTLLYFFPTLYLFNFAKKIKLGLNSSIQSEVELAFENLKKMFKYMGILMVIMLSVYALVLLFGIGASIAGF